MSVSEHAENYLTFRGGLWYYRPYDGVSPKIEQGLIIYKCNKDTEKEMKFSEFRKKFGEGTDFDLDYGKLFIIGLCIYIAVQVSWKNTIWHFDSGGTSMIV